MTTKGKIIVVVSGLVILSGLSYLVYKFVIKPAQDKKPKDPVAPAVAPPSPDTVNKTTPPPAPYSKYGFKKGEALYAKSNYMPVYSYPDVMDPNKHIGYINPSAVSKITFIGDAGTTGWIKAIAKYTIKSSSSTEKVGEVYILASAVTNVAP